MKTHVRFLWTAVGLGIAERACTLMIQIPVLSEYYVQKGVAAFCAVLLIRVLMGHILAVRYAVSGRRESVVVYLLPLLFSLIGVCLYVAVVANRQEENGVTSPDSRIDDSSLTTE